MGDIGHHPDSWGGVSMCLKNLCCEGPTGYWGWGLCCPILQLWKLRLRGTGKKLRPSALGVSAAARRVTTGD